MKYLLTVLYTLISLMFLHDAKIAIFTPLAVFDYVCAIYFAYRAFKILNTRKVGK